ncbi:hypothetical protein GCM10011344_06940 [Dokdonia pacifica]|nr:hypothetical protein GCM10011344_06940 [Dokdonia pacifica]
MQIFFDVSVDKFEIVKQFIEDQLGTYYVQDFIEYNKKLSWVNYALLPIALFLRVLIIALVLNVGFYLTKIELPYKTILKIVVKAEYVFLLAILIKMIWFNYFIDNYGIEYLQNFYPFSGLNITGYHINPIYIYPLKKINLFEVAYCFLIGYFVSKESNIGFSNGLITTTLSYGSALALWVLFFMFSFINNN